MKRLALLSTILFLCLSSAPGAICAMLREIIYNAPQDINSNVPQDTISRGVRDSLLRTVKQDSAGAMNTPESLLRDSLVRDSIIRDSIIRDSIIRDSIIRDSIIRDSLIRDSVVRDSIIRDSIVRDSLARVAAREAIRYDFSPVYQTDVYVPSAQEVPAGQYSGITYLGANRYAVVHDKLNGGGIVFFDIAITNNGKVASVKATVPAFTSKSKVSGRDNEDIAFVPAESVSGAEAAESGIVSGTLFISSESAQTILEYTLEGKETGRSLKVPSAFKKDKIVANNGFEALTYNALNKTFWTTTETPLKADGKDSRLLRLQSFDSNLKAGKQYLYKMDAPVKTAAEGAAAKAYVHGVPALVALDDGSLIVLEREVYVPNGGLFVKALTSFTRTLLYVVTPEGSVSGSSLSSTSPAKSAAPSSKKSEFLEKRLLISFSTSSLNLANFEGMCLGPELPGGWHTLILIADSQDGSNGLTSEYIKVLAFR